MQRKLLLGVFFVPESWPFSFQLAPLTSSRRRPPFAVILLCPMAHSDFSCRFPEMEQIAASTTSGSISTSDEWKFN